MNFQDLPLKSRHKLGFDIFLARAREKHGERFLYDRSSWVSTQKKLRICCSAHGWFEQVPYDHLKFNCGCYQCAKSGKGPKVKRGSLVKFTERATARHQGRFEYDLSSWGGMHAKVRVFCQKHGWFEQIAKDHLRDDLSGCRGCGMELSGLRQRLTEEELIERFRSTHGLRYDYSAMEYSGMVNKIVITCKDHGAFRQKVDDHSRGDGCPRCGGRHRWTTKEFIQNSKQHHPGKYTYKNTKYVGSLADVIITCKVHGDFITQPSRHILKKRGCARCSPHGVRTLEDFVGRAKDRFGDRYDYSIVEYVDSKTPVKIVCKRHGVFEQPPSWHLNSAIGCQQCSYNVSSKETAWLDSLNLPSTVKRQTKVMIDGRRRHVDAVDHSTRTIYEFWGDWWHGNPKFFARDEIHPKTKKTYGELYKETLAKRRAIKRAGFNLVEIWEHRYDSLVKRGKMLAPGVAEYATVE